jgi:hypothetical protein
MSLMAFEPYNFVGAKLKRILNGFGIPNVKLLNPDLRSRFGIYKSRKIGIGILLGTLCSVFAEYRYFI